MSLRAPLRLLFGFLAALLLAGVLSGLGTALASSSTHDSAGHAYDGTVAVAGVAIVPSVARALPSTTAVKSTWDSARLVEFGVAANAGTRLAQDIAVNPVAPRALGLGRSIGRASHNQALQTDIAALSRGATDIRVNQQQVNALGHRVGVNRPDLQYTLGWRSGSVLSVARQVGLSELDVVWPGGSTVLVP